MMIMKNAVAFALLLAGSEAWNLHRPSATVIPRHSSSISSSSRSAVAVPLPDVNDNVTTQQEEKKQQQIRSSINKDDEWVANLDYEGFTREVNQLGKELLQDTGEDDVAHLNKMVLWRDICAFVGIATMWMTPNPLTVAALSTWAFSSWAMIAHHTCHGGYNRVDAGKFNSRGFALGSLKRRLADWMDWMVTEAWNVEHNRLHHYHLGEVEVSSLLLLSIDVG
jgi:hypothetical protein